MASLFVPLPLTCASVLSPELRRVEANAALGPPLSEEDALELYPALLAAQEALERLADGLERLSSNRAD